MLLVLSLFPAFHARAGGGDGGQTVTFLSNPTNIGTRQVTCAPQGGWVQDYWVSIGVAAINNDSYLDVLRGETVQRCTGQEGKWYVGPNFNNGNGTFGNPPASGDFYMEGTLGSNDKEIRKVVFGKLRNTNMLDVAVARKNRTEIRYNSGGVIADPANQALNAYPSVDLVWADYELNSTDNLLDLIIADSNSIKVFFNNVSNGTVGVPHPDPNQNTPNKDFAFQLYKIFAAQLDNLYKDDLVGISPNNSDIKVYLNDASNNLNLSQTLSFGAGHVASLAIGDINNDGRPDLVVNDAGTIKLFLNTHTQGNPQVFDTTPFWQAVAATGEVGIADFGAYDTATKNDGWNDIVIVSSTAIKLFMNRHNVGGEWFRTSPEQTINMATSSIPIQLITADVQNYGGISIVFAMRPASSTSGNPGEVRYALHVGDPAPAPPKNVQVVPVPREYGYADARVTWSTNTESDLLGYRLYRRVTGICGNGVWYLLADESVLTASNNQYLDQLSTVMQNGDCLAQYKLVAVDNAHNLSDYSAIVEIAFSSSMWKATGHTNNAPKQYAFHSAYPNPFNPSTQINFDLPEDGFVALSVYDVLGRKVADLANSNYVAGYHSVLWNAASVSSGMYFIHFSAIGADGGVKLSKVSKVLLTK
jgi:hypothetical protein